MKKAILLLLIIAVCGWGCHSNKETVLDPGERGSDKLMYERAMKGISRDPEKARLLLKEVIQLFPESIYVNKARLGIADSYFKEHDAASLVMAAAEYQDYVGLYPFSPDAVYAKFQIGMCYYRQMKRPERDQTNTYQTIKAFEALIQQYPNTPEAADAQKKITEARDILATHYFLIGFYNYKLKAHKGAIARFKQVIDEFPEFKKNDEMFYLTGKCYQAIADPESALSFFQRVISSYPKSKYVKKSQKLILQINRQKERAKKSD